MSLDGVLRRYQSALPFACSKSRDTTRAKRTMRVQCKAPDLGDAQLVEAVQGFDVIERNADVSYSTAADARRCCMRRERYGAVYACVDGNIILALAVAHLHGRPGYWNDRLMQQNS